MFSLATWGCHPVSLSLEWSSSSCKNPTSCSPVSSDWLATQLPASMGRVVIFGTDFHHSYRELLPFPLNLFREKCPARPRANSCHVLPRLTSLLFCSRPLTNPHTCQHAVFIGFGEVEVARGRQPAIFVDSFCSLLCFFLSIS